jgi:hypothetical protein
MSRARVNGAAHIQGIANHDGKDCENSPAGIPGYIHQCLLFAKALSSISSTERDNYRLTKVARHRFNQKGTASTSYRTSGSYAGWGNDSCQLTRTLEIAGDGRKDWKSAHEIGILAENKYFTTGASTII